MAENAYQHNISSSSLYKMFSWAFEGVDFSLPGNGGTECINFLSPEQRLVESGLASLLALFICYKAYPRLTLPATKPRALSEGEASGKRLLLVLMCLTWGCELGFKFATRQMIWIFNPCHVATAVQIYLLAAAPSKAVTAAFRLHLHMLTGAPIAILFPVVNTRLLPFETEVYYIQHVLMLVIPFYLMHLGDPYVPERLGDFSWAAMTFGVAFLYHFIPLQLLAIATGINLNNMLCPAVSDPFHGRFYRLFAIGHQTLLIPSLGKIYAALARRLGWCPDEEEASVAQLIKEELAAKEASSFISDSATSQSDEPPNGDCSSHHTHSSESSKVGGNLNHFLASDRNEVQEKVTHDEMSEETSYKVVPEASTAKDRLRSRDGNKCTSSKGLQEEEMEKLASNGHLKDH